MSDTRNVNIIFESNAETVTNQVNNLDKSIDNVSNSTDSAVKSQQGFTKSLGDNSNAVLENGGAMGLLNDLTGGYAMMVKDAVEASALFITKKKADTVATGALTAATVTSNTATQQGIITKIKDIASTAASTVAKGISTAATNVATAAQWLWNAAVVANPLVALVVALVAAGAAIYTFTKFLIDSSKANEDAAASTAKHKKELEAQSIAAAKSGNKLKDYNDHLYNMAEAAGASAEELRKLRLKHIEEEITLNKSNATIARNTFIRERNTLATLKAADASDEVIEAQTKVTESAYKEFQEQNNLLDTSYKTRAAIRKQNEVDVVKERTAAKEKADKDAKAANDKAIADGKKAEEDKAKSILDARKKYLKDTEIGDGVQTTSNEEIINKIKTDGEAVNEANKEVMEADLENKIAIGNNDSEELKNKAAIDAQFETDKNDVIATSQQNLSNIIEGLQVSGLAKTKAGQAISKAMALTQIGIDSAVAISKASTLANAEGVAAQLAFPMVPGAGTIARVLSYTSTALSVVSNMARARAILSGGGNSGGGSVNNGSGGRISASAQPNVSFVSSSENQIASTISNNQSTTPIKTYVVSKEISSSQELERNAINSTTIG